MFCIVLCVVGRFVAGVIVLLLWRLSWVVEFCGAHLLGCFCDWYLSLSGVQGFPIWMGFRFDRLPFTSVCWRCSMLLAWSLIVGLG